MIKRIFYSWVSSWGPIILYIPVVIIFVIVMLFSVDTVEESQSKDTIINQSCNIPSDYCNSSIKALEQELKQSHRINDRCANFMGREKQELRDSIVQCAEVLDNCNRNLKQCVLTLEGQCDVLH